MKNSCATVVSVAALIAGLGVSGGVVAQSTWNMPGGCTAIASSGFGNSTTCAATTGGATYKASAWSAAVDIPSGGPATGFTSAYLSNQGSSGLGASSQVDPSGSPNHSFDSQAPGTIDMLLLDFGSNNLATLNTVGIKWSSGDADISVLRWIGGPTGPSTSGGILTSTISSAGWELVSSYAGFAANSTAQQNWNTGYSNATKSSWWLISTFNTSVFGASTTCTVGSSSPATKCDEGDDGFKLNYIAATVVANPTTPNQVPEPGSLALAGAALAGMFGMRRRGLR